MKQTLVMAVVACGIAVPAVLPAKPGPAHQAAVPGAITGFLSHRCKKFKVKEVRHGDVTAKCSRKGPNDEIDPDGKLNETDISVWVLAKGSFLTRNAEEIVLGVYGDTPHSEGNTYGFVMRRTKRAFVPVQRVLKGRDRMQLLTKFRRKSGTDLLVVCSASCHQGECEGDCSSVDLSSKTRPQVLVPTYFNDGCDGDTANCHSGHNVVYGHEVRDVNGDGMPDLILRVQSGEGTKDGEDQPSSSPQSQPARRYELKVLFDGMQLKPERPMP